MTGIWAQQFQCLSLFTCRHLLLGDLQTVFDHHHRCRRAPTRQHIVSIWETGLVGRDDMTRTVMMMIGWVGGMQEEWEGQ